MQVIIVLPVDKIDPAAGFQGQEALTDMARTAEAAGFAALSVTDHPVPSGRWLDGGGHHAQDPFVSLAFAAALTERIRLLTAILVAPYRNPFITARAVSTLDFASNGRMVLGAGAGYLKAEYRALGADFDNRNDIMDEYLSAMKAAWTQDEFSFEGSGYSAREARMLPRPVQRPHPPVWIGGNSRRAIRRAVDFGDAWMPFNASGDAPVAKTARTVPMGNPAEVAQGIAYLREYADKVGKPAPRDIVLDALRAPTAEWNAQARIDQIESYAQLGVTWVGLGVGGASRSEWRDNAVRFGAEVLAKLGARTAA